jgi:phosphoglycolate phosphatase-like HAD superfamily hydrolase
VLLATMSPPHRSTSFVPGTAECVAILPAVMIGDHAVDVAAASALGIASVFAGWGYGHIEPASQPSAVATSFADLPGILESLVPTRIRSLG